MKENIVVVRRDDIKTLNTTKNCYHRLKIIKRDVSKKNKITYHDLIEAVPVGQQMTITSSFYRKSKNISVVLIILIMHQFFWATSIRQIMKAIFPVHENKKI